MKKILIFFAILLTTGLVYAKPPSPITVVLSSDCSTITSGGCIDTDDGRFYVWNGSAVVEVTASLITVTDNESTNETNAVIFSSGGDVDGGTFGLESDGDFHYNPSTGTLTVTEYAGGFPQSQFIDGGADAIDGDKLEITWTPSSITPDTGIAEADSADDLSAIFEGIEDWLDDIDSDADGAVDNIEVPITVTEDSGAVTLWNMIVSATPAAGTEQSFSTQIDSTTIFKVYAEADSSGSIQNPGVQRLVGTHSESTDTQTWTASELMNPIVTNKSWDGADDLNIDASAITGNMRFTYVVHEGESDTATININPDDAAIIVLDGTELAAGDSVEIVDPARGAQITFTTIDDGGTIYIYAVTDVGAWVDGN